VLDGGLLAPGFIDVQVNGGGGALLNGEPSFESVRTIAESHRKHGVTGLLPTVITDSPEVLSSAIGAVRQARRLGVPGVLGIHVEGPFLDPARKGAHDARFIRAAIESDVEQLGNADCGLVMLTLAPNMVPPTMIAKFVEAGLRVSLGHSDATAEESFAALQAGASAFTHLYNAMSQMNGRAPGMAGAALADQTSFVGVIADGHHVHPAALRVAFTIKPNRMMLISDAMPAAAGGPDRFLLQGREVLRRNGRLELADHTLAGADITMADAVLYCVNTLGFNLETVLRAASLTPAIFLGRDNDLGRIRPGYLASLVHLDDDLRVRQTWIDGL
jgi:N-acetylglucosamine-6-phosphate deacetylase